MYKTIQFNLNQFHLVPNKLRINQNNNIADTDFTVDLARLYHHYYTDSYLISPPDPDYSNFEYLRFLDGCLDFRFMDARVSTSVGHKRTISYKMGQAFCRYFLYEFCGITYFAHMDKIINRVLPAFNGMRISRVTPGDIPDYLCARSVSNPFIAEAKGRFSNISFNSQEFNEWRSQFNRIKVTDRNLIPKRIKGYIIGTKFTTSEHSYRNKSKLMAEDPETKGESLFEGDEIGLGRGCISIHYSRLVSKLGLQLLASSLAEGFIIPEDLQFNLPVWKCNYPPLQGETFVGGYISDYPIEFIKKENNHLLFYPNIFRLGVPNPQFYGIRSSTLKQLRRVMLGNLNMLNQISELPDTEYRPSNLAWLRDGSISGALDYFEYIGNEIF